MILYGEVYVCESGTESGRELVCQFCAWVVAINLCIVIVGVIKRPTPFYWIFDRKRNVAHKAIKKPQNSANLLKLSTFTPFYLLLVSVNECDGVTILWENFSIGHTEVLAFSAVRSFGGGRVFNPEREVEGRSPSSKKYWSERIFSSPKIRQTTPTPKKYQICM